MWLYNLVSCFLQRFILQYSSHWSDLCCRKQAKANKHTLSATFQITTHLVPKVLMDKIVIFIYFETVHPWFSQIQKCIASVIWTRVVVWSVWWDSRARVMAPGCDIGGNRQRRGWRGVDGRGRERKMMGMCQPFFLSKCLEGNEGRSLIGARCKSPCHSSSSSSLMRSEAKGSWSSAAPGGKKNTKNDAKTCF